MRASHCIGLALLMVLGVTVATSANIFADRFTFTRPPATESVVDPKGGRNIDIVQWSTPADRDRLVAAITPAWLWWNASAPSTPYHFSVVQIRFGKNGTGEGRLSLGVPVTADKTLGVAIADYDEAPALLTDVRAEQLGTH